MKEYGKSPMNFEEYKREMERIKNAFGWPSMEYLSAYMARNFLKNNQTSAPPVKIKRASGWELDVLFEAQDIIEGKQNDS